jgi:hypothetical protein
LAALSHQCSRLCESGDSKQSKMARRATSALCRAPDYGLHRGNLAVGGAELLRAQAWQHSLSPAATVLEPAKTIRYQNRLSASIRCCSSKLMSGAAIELEIDVLGRRRLGVATPEAPQGLAEYGERCATKDRVTCATHWGPTYATARATTKQVMDMDGAGFQEPLSPDVRYARLRRHFHSNRSVDQFARRPQTVQDSFAKPLWSMVAASLWPCSSERAHGEALSLASGNSPRLLHQVMIWIRRQRNGFGE